MIADIAHGHLDFADIMFLVAMILGVVAAIANYGAQTARHTLPLVALAVASVALGFLVL
jgi:hypothetical protein